MKVLSGLTQLKIHFKLRYNCSAGFQQDLLQLFLLLPLL